ncbi:MAG: hypothetical protein Q9215_004611 [Flavoplaca cf. flavocitrina]
MDPPSRPSVIDHDALLSLNPSIDVLDLERKHACDLTDHLDQTHSSAADVIIPRILKTDKHAIAPRSSACVCRWMLTSGKTVALDLAIDEFQPDPSNADKMRNLSRGLTRFRTERENKGVHGRSFRGGFSSFAASGQKARSLDAGGFLSLPYLCLDQLLHATTPRSSILHSPKTLLQHHFRFDEYASDKDESFPSAESGKHILGPPMRALTVLTDELWGLCLDERKLTPNFAVLEQKSGVNNTLVLPRRDGETFQDLERDLQAHITRFKIERHYLWSHRGVSKTYDFLEDIESASGNISSHCLMHARMSIMARSARHYPSKALLHDISKTCEELEIMKGIIKTQQKAHSKIVGAIDRSLPTTKSESRDCQQSETNRSPKDATERSFIGRSAWMKTVKVLEDIEQLQGEGKRLAEQTVQLVDIKVEDQGKAVMVFTIVTVIFLPLSFVSSYFGMNTADIRELQHGQWIFWAVGLSVTFCTVVIALLIAFRGQRWKRRWNEKYLWDKERGMKVQ